MTIVLVMIVVAMIGIMMNPAKRDGPLYCGAICQSHETDDRRPRVTP